MLQKPGDCHEKRKDHSGWYCGPHHHRLGGSGPTINWYRYTGEQYDTDLGLYYLRARYYKPEIGRFWTMDSYEGDEEDPSSLHKYIYCAVNPVNGTDPSGHLTYTEVLIVSTLSVVVAASFYEATSSAINRIWGSNPTPEQASALKNARDYIKQQQSSLPRKLKRYGKIAVGTTIKVHKSFSDGAFGKTSSYGNLFGNVIHLASKAFELDSKLLASLLVHEAVHTSQWRLPGTGEGDTEKKAFQIQSDVLRFWHLENESIFQGLRDREFIGIAMQQFSNYKIDQPVWP